MTHGAVRFLIYALEAVLLVVLLSTAVLAWRLSQGTIKLDVVAPYIASAVSGVTPGFRFGIAGAEFKWAGFKSAPELTMRDVRVLNDSGAVIAGLPRMIVRLSVPALRRGLAAPDQVLLSNPIIRFVHRADGSLGLGVEGAPAISAPSPSSAPAQASSDLTSSNALAVSLIGALTSAPGGDNPAGYLDRVGIENTTLVLVDEVSGQRWLAPDATLNFRRAGADVEIEATLPVVEEGKRWDLTAKGRYSAASGDLKVNLNIDGFRPARVAGLAPQLAPFGMIDLRLTGTAAATLRLSKSGARFSDLQFDVKGQDGQLHLPEPVAEDFPVKAISLKGAAGADLNDIRIEQFRVELNGGGKASPVITLTGEGSVLNSAPVVALNLSMAELTVPALKQFWPVGIKPNTRSWIDQNLSEGGLYDLRLKLVLAGSTIDALAASEARFTTELRGAKVKFMRSMPEVEGTTGRITVSGSEAVFDITAGHVPDAVSGKRLNIPSGMVRMYGLGSGGERANIQLKIAGEFGDIMRLIDHEPLGYARALGIDANRAEGRADVDLTLDFPLIKELKFDQMELGVQARAEGIAIPEVAFGLPLTAGHLALHLDRAGMDVSGSAALGGIPTTIAWRENFGGGDFRSQYILDPILGNDQRALIGLSTAPFIPPYIDGAVPANVIYTVMHDDTRKMEARVDLTAPTVAISELGWHKEPGRTAVARVEATFTKTGLNTIPAFQITSGDDLDVSGSATFRNNGKMRSLTIKPSVIGETRLSGEVLVDEVGGYTVDISGPSFNSTYFWKELGRDDKRRRTSAGSSDTAFSTPLKLRASFDRMWLTKNADFTGVSLDYERDYTGIQAIEFMSNVDGTTPFTFKLASEDAGRKFRGSGVNGGSVVRAVGLFDDIVGGNLEFNGEFAADGSINGLAVINDFKLVRAPVLARLLSVASLTGIVDELSGKGISFGALRVPFLYQDATLTVRDGEMSGSSLGLTGAGSYSFDSSLMNFDGTLIPAYSINSLLSSIPLIGPILSGGEKGGGIFAATYSYRGDVATAQPVVNPLAVFAPGFLRHIFDIFKPGAPKEPSTSPVGEKPVEH